MPAYVIVEVSITDATAYEQYKQLTPATISAYEGKFVVRGGNPISVEGDWNPERIVVLEFPTMQHAKDWWNSSEYLPAKEIRQSAASTKMIFVEGV